MKKTESKCRMVIVSALILELLLLFCAAGTGLAGELNCYTQTENAVARRIQRNMLDDQWATLSFMADNLLDGQTEALDTLPGNLCYQIWSGSADNGTLLLESAGTVDEWVEGKTPLSVNGQIQEIEIRVGINSEYPEKDVFSDVNGAVRTLHRARFALPIGLALSALLELACIIYLCGALGRDPETGETHPGWFSRIPLDLLLAAYVAAGALIIALLLSIDADGVRIVSMIVLLPFVLTALAALPITAAVRIRSGTFWRNTMVARILRLLIRAVRRLAEAVPLVPKTIGTAVGLTIFNILVIIGASRAAMLLIALAEAAVLIPLVVSRAVQELRLQQMAQQMADGTLDRPMEVEQLHGIYRKHGESLNRIRDGIEKAVAAQLRSERLKTELITNVSHDLKTPLTSIINYTDLLQRESLQNETAAGYVEVLRRQSERLKKLVTDLIEASKASTGNLPVHLTDCAASVLLSQAEGEYHERMAAAQLEPVLHLPDPEVMIRADGRHLGRILDNLMGNICKYAQPGTRVYLSAEKMGETGVLIFRNVSRARLDVAPEELMERFVRGDASRSSEGSGLGLAIVRSLTELQGGRMELNIDGDLFKVTLLFPCADAQPSTDSAK